MDSTRDSGKPFRNPVGSKSRDPQLQRQCSNSSTSCVKKQHATKRDSWVTRREVSLHNMRISTSKSLVSANAFSWSKTLEPTLENSYQPQPERRFSVEETQAVIKAVADDLLQDVEYDGEACSALTVRLAERIKEAAKGLLYPRYKLICFVVLAQTKHAEVSCSSRSLWCPGVDSYAEYCFKNHSLLALCVLYAVYQE
ncbi:dynein light chain Tctex-type 5-A [Amia ocellicauda]|uniref:dynein light chain Tctex-type 5-A n=1 Tax=Amia ocellicauda TaxID=2972642 RepID=UPI003464DCB0